MKGTAENAEGRGRRDLPKGRGAAPSHDLSANHTNHTNGSGRPWPLNRQGLFVSFVWFVDRILQPEGSWAPAFAGGTEPPSATSAFSAVQIR